jgi:hypothetical protein
MKEDRKRIIEEETERRCTYDSTDLANFQKIVEEILEEAGITGCDQQLKAAVGAALFAWASKGERDYERLKQKTRASVLLGGGVH